MLGLRPRLKSRPSLLDLVRRESIDQISQQRPALLENDLPLDVPLPKSPIKEIPSEEASEEVAIVISPPPYLPPETTPDPEGSKDIVKKMPPVGYVP